LPDIPLTPVVVVDKRPILNDEDPRSKVVGEVGGKVVEEVDDTATDLRREEHEWNGQIYIHRGHRLGFLTYHGSVHDTLRHQGEPGVSPLPGEKGDHGNSTDDEHGYQRSYQAGATTKASAESVAQHPFSIAGLTVLVPMIGASSQTERQEDQGKGEPEEDQPEPVDPSPVEDHPGPDGLGSVFPLDLFLETEVRGGDRDGCEVGDRREWISEKVRMNGVGL
jgi:hypothetical protein